MKRTPIDVRVSDHAVLRYLEREHGLDVSAVRNHLADSARSAAEIGAIALQVERVKLIFQRSSRQVTIVTVLPRGPLTPNRRGKE